MQTPDIDAETQAELRVILCLSFFDHAPAEEIHAFRKCLTDCPHVRHSIEVAGSFDLILEAELKDISEYHDRLEAMAASLQKLVSKRETSFVCGAGNKPQSLADGYTQSFWVPCEEGHRIVHVEDIEKITAEGDYMRLHVRDHSHLIHCTIKSLCEQLDPDLFVHLHRSVLVRKDMIERIVHEKRRWLARLRDGCLQPISKSHTRDVLRRVLH